MRGLIFGFYILISTFSFDQRTCDSIYQAQPGTYSVTIDSSAFEGTNVPDIIMLSDLDLCLIESSRKSTESTQIHIGVYLITIYPKKKIVDNTINE